MLIWLVASPAHDAVCEAHPENSPALVNRYITIVGHSTQLELSVALLYGQVPAAEARRAADADADGQLSEAEIDKLKRHLGDQPGFRLRVRHNGRWVDDSSRSIALDLGGHNGTGAQSLVIESRLSLPAQPGEHNLELLPGPALARGGETEVMATLGSGWKLLRSQGPGGPHAYVHTITAERSAPSASVYFTLRRDGREVAPSTRWWLAPLVTVAAVLGALLLLHLRRKQRKREGGAKFKGPARRASEAGLDKES